MLSLGGIHFEDSFALTKGQDRMTLVGFSMGCHAHGAALTGCRMALVALAGPFLTLLAQTGVGTTLLPL